jgi:hypothetical protein
MAVAAVTWSESKDKGKHFFSQGNYNAALTSYLTALDQLTSLETRDGNDKSNDKQILLSNVVACRLKIGGEDMATQAVEDAKQVSSSQGCTLDCGAKKRITSQEIDREKENDYNISLVRVLDPPPT